MLRTWQYSSLTLLASTDQATKRAINKWLDDFEVIFRRNVTSINQLNGYAGWVIGQMYGKVNGVIPSQGLYDYELYRATYTNFILRLTNQDLTRATMLRNNLAMVWKSGWKDFYNAYDNFTRVSLAAGIPSSQIAERFLAKELYRDFTYMVDAAGRKWEPANYARMYSNTRANEVSVDTTLERLTELEIDMVQVSDHNTLTPLCQEFEGRVYSLKGKTEGLPVLEILPPFHPNCKHRIRPITRRISQSDAIVINNELSKRYEVMRSDYTASQLKQINKQKQWNLENRR